ncbi:MAG: DUF4185 domain-containing protein [Planctomycetota bacterium]
MTFRTYNHLAVAVVVGVVSLAVALRAAGAAESAWLPCPYPSSELIAGIDFDASTRQSHAPGSDIWPITWADDDHQYTAFGDGAGFGSTGTFGRRVEGYVSLGVARIEGSAGNYRGVNVWGGVAAENPAQFEGKGTGMLSVDGVLYMIVGGPKSLVVGETRPAVSRDHARTWTLTDWKWTMHDRVSAGALLNFGKDYAGARDDFVYVYFTRIQDLPADGKPRNWIHEVPGQVDLARVPKDRVLEKAAYEWFAGVNDDGAPRWTDDISARTPAFEDPNGIKVVSVSYNLALRRYLLLYNPKNNRGHFALFESPEPWGPWRTVAYLKDHPLFMPPEENSRVSVFHFAPKWWSGDGREFTLIFNTGDDRWNTVRGQLLGGQKG